MTESELLAMIGQAERSALGSSVAAGPYVGGQLKPAGQSMTTLEVDRYNALNAYMGRPLGNEQEGRSSVVLTEFRDTVEWIMPQLMRMFAATQTICQFDAEHEGDEDQADMETRAVNYVFMQQNNGFFVLHDMFKDALMLRNGYARAYWKESTESRIESYTGLTETELTRLVSGDDSDDEENPDEIEVLEQREYPVQIAPPMLAVAGMAPAQPTSIQAFDVKIRRTAKKGRIVVECLPPEEVLVSPRARTSFDETPFFEHKTTVMRSQLTEMGFDASQVGAITLNSPDWLNLISLARDVVTDQLGEDEPADKAAQDVSYRDIYMKVDWDGDGVAERRHIIVCGNKIFENEEAPEIPCVYCAPVRMPHRHVGISYYDLLNDLQNIKTELWRQGLDNLFIMNNQRTAVDWTKTNMSDLLTSRPGGVVRTNGAPQNAIMPIVSPGNAMQQAIPAMEYVDLIREMRTGIGKDTMGVDADSLQDVTKGGQLAAMSAAAMKVELVARMLAEGVKDLFRKIHSALIMHQNQPLSIALSGKWVNIDPTQWKTRTKVSVNVGLGSGTREESRANLQLLAAMQQQLGQLGLVGPKQAFATFKRGVHLLGFEDPTEFAMDPDSPEYQQHMQQMQQMQQQNPQVQVAQIRANSATQVAQGRQMSQILDLKGQLAKAHAEVQHAAIQAEQDRGVDRASLDAQMAQTLVKVIGQIVAQQLKQAPTIDAGQLLSRDYQEAQQGIQ